VRRKPDISRIGIGLSLSKKLIHMAQTDAAIAGFSRQLLFEVGKAAVMRFENIAFKFL
jgi:hypothetical protein